MPSDHALASKIPIKKSKKARPAIRNNTVQEILTPGQVEVLYFSGFYVIEIGTFTLAAGHADIPVRHFPCLLYEAGSCQDWFARIEQIDQIFIGHGAAEKCNDILAEECTELAFARDAQFVKGLINQRGFGSMDLTRLPFYFQIELMGIICGVDLREQLIHCDFVSPKIRKK